jgi:type I restriction enzyme M protein
MALIPTLSDDDVKKLLHDKWITPLCEQLGTVPDSILSDFIASVKRLDKKYSRTLQKIEQEKEDVEKKLSGLLSNLSGNEYDMAAFKQLRELFGGKDE